MNEKTTIDVNKVPKITKFIYTLGVLPTSYLMSMTYQEQLTWLCNYIVQTLIPAINTNIEAVQELQELYELLRQYVNDYFDNLDVQDEINNKIDEMAESGQLTDIIAQYLGLAGVLAFNTIADLEEAQNIVDGSTCRTLGANNYNDGKGAYYKIRPITSSDVVDGFNIIALDISNTLIGERINEDITKKYIFMGDSYADGYSPDGNTTSWISLLVQKLNLTNDEYISTHQGGYGFSTNRPDYNYINLLNNLSYDDDIIDMYVCGGYNDLNQTESDIILGITNFNNAFKLKFPNGKLHIGFIGWSNDSTKINSLKNTFIAYKKACNENNIDLLNGCEYSLHNYFKYFSSDGIHPNQLGQNNIASALYNCIISGNANVIETENITFTIENGGSNNVTWEMILSNGLINISSNITGISGISFTDPITLTGNNQVEIGTLTNSLIIGTDKQNIVIPINCVYAIDNSHYSFAQFNLLIKNKKLYLQSPHAEGTNYSSINVKGLQITTFNQTFNALNC